MTVPRDYDEDPAWCLTSAATATWPGHAASFLRCHGMGERAAASAAATLDLPLSLTMRGCVVYATKG